MQSGHLGAASLAALLGLSGLARAEPLGAQALPVDMTPKADAAETTKTEVEEPPRNYVSLGLGGSTASSGLVLCAEVAPLAVLAFSACGTGAGVLNDQARPEIAHFRASVSPLSWKVTSVWLQPRLHAGFAEMQVGEDAAGFDFAGTSATGMATAGPEAGASLRGLMPLAYGVELIGELSLGLAYFHHAPELLRPQAAWQPSATMTIGVGF